jgi:hypothetical protein
MRHGPIDAQRPCRAYLYINITWIFLALIYTQNLFFTVSVLGGFVLFMVNFICFDAR